MMFENDRTQDLWFKDKEKASRLKNEIITLLKNEHISISEARYLFRVIICTLEDTQMQLSIYNFFTF